MKADTAFIVYHGKPQYQFAAGLLAPITACDFCIEYGIEGIQTMGILNCNV